MIFYYVTNNKIKDKLTLFKSNVKKPTARFNIYTHNVLVFSFQNPISPEILIFLKHKTTSQWV